MSITFLFFVKKILNFYFKSKIVNKLVKKFEKLCTFLLKIFLLYIKTLKTSLYKNVKRKGYISSNKIWFNSKYIKIKQNYKFKNKFFLYILGIISSNKASL